MSGAEEIGKRSGDAQIEADLAARQELIEFHKEVGGLVEAIEAYMIPRDLTLGHFEAAVEAFNKRNQIVMPEMKMGAIKKLFEKISDDNHAR